MLQVQETGHVSLPTRAHKLHCVWQDMSATRPCNNEKFYIYSDGTHTHTPCRSRVDEMKMEMTMKWQTT